MTEPDARHRHDPSPRRMRALVEATGLTYAQLAERIGCSVRSLERWLAEGGRTPYPEQYLIEALAAQAVKAKAAHHKPLVREPPPTPPAATRRHPLAGLLPRKDTPS